MEDYICKRCGESYDLRSIEPPEDATFHWVPDCPACGAYMTENVVNRNWLNIIGSRLDSQNKDYDRYYRKLHYQARLHHGRVAGLTADELVELAKYFSDYIIHGRRFGPEAAQKVARRLRLQAIEKMKSD